MRSPRLILPALLLLLVQTLPGRVARGQIALRDHFSRVADQTGRALSRLDDLDGDGCDDYFVGAPYDSRIAADAGRADVYSGRTGAVLFSFRSSVASEMLGQDAASIGDLDGDGVTDFAVGAADFYYPGFTGTVYTYSGRTGTLIWSFSSTYSGIGRKIGPGGDLDSDGIRDTLSADGSYVTAFDETGGIIFQLPCGAYVTSFAGDVDVDGDGVPDVLIGDVSANLFTGEVWVYSGATQSLIGTIASPRVGGFFGGSLAWLDDLTGDGVPEIAIAAQNDDTYGMYAGRIVITDPVTRSEVYSVFGSTNEWIGAAEVRSGRDVDGDGFRDFAVGVSPQDASAIQFARVYSGRTGVVLYEYKEPAGSASVAWATAIAIGDWNGDGLGDLVVGDSLCKLPMRPNTLGMAKAYLSAPALRETYGAGWPGALGVPALVALQDPVPGNQLDVQLDNSSATTTIAWLMAGFSETNVPTNKGGSLLVVPSFSMLLFLSGPTLVLTAHIPNDPALHLVELFVQAVELDAAASNGLSFTPGLRLKFGFDYP